MADNMLGTLAKWLRVAGADCEYAHGKDDDELLAVAASGRTVLTRDKLLAQRCGPQGLYIPSDDLEEQLLQVFEEFPAIRDLPPLSRCLVCNVDVVPARPDEVGDMVPQGVLERRDEFRLCPQCGRVYWSGTHVEDMLARLETLVGKGDQGQG